MVKIEVTQEDINKGWNGNETSCPIHRAARRVLGRGSLEVFTDELDFNGDTYVLPRRAEKFSTVQAEALDGQPPTKAEALKKLKPFSFNLPISPNLEKKASPIEIKKKKAAQNE